MPLAHNTSKGTTGREEWLLFCLLKIPFPASMAACFQPSPTALFGLCRSTKKEQSLHPPARSEPEERCMGTNTQAGLECWCDTEVQAVDFVALNQTETRRGFPDRRDSIRSMAKFCFVGTATTLQSPGHGCVPWWHRLSNPWLFISPSHTAEGAEQCSAATDPCSQHSKIAENSTDAHNCAGTPLTMRVTAMTQHSPVSLHIGRLSQQ